MRASIDRSTSEQVIVQRRACRTRALGRMESVQRLQRGTYGGRRLWLLGGGDTRDGVVVSVLHEEKGARSKPKGRGRVAEQARFCCDSV